ncbi:hypothetical protein KKB69_01105 [Patescibacteria group bacterium]|nr:hypothetical protein [Patescibacteria group bacterium]
MNSLKFDLRTTYLERLADSVGSGLFRRCFCKDDKGALVDVCSAGLFACVVFASNFLKIHDLIKVSMANVGTFENELISCGWTVFSGGGDPPAGSVLFWEPRMGSDGNLHRHVGFYYFDELAISNDPRNLKEGSTRAPIMHKMDCSDVLGYVRKIEKVYFHPLLKC